MRRRSHPTLTAGRSTAALACAALCCTAWPACADLSPVSSNGPPQQIIPQFAEVGAPVFVTRVAPPPAPVTPVSTDPGDSSGGDTGPDTSGTLAKMQAQPWGAQAEQNAAALKVSGVALAANCVIESQCSSNPASHGTISGTFQMMDDTYLAMQKEVAARNPALAASMGPGLSGKNDPAAQAIASAQYLYDGAKILQNAGIANPTVTDTRPMYNFGLSGGKALALADPSALMSSTVSLTAAGYTSNGINPATTTVGQWRQSLANKVGSAANAAVLIN